MGTFKNSPPVFLNVPVFPPVFPNIFLNVPVSPPGGVQTISATDTVTPSITGSANVTVLVPPIANDDLYGVHENLTVNVPSWIGVLSNDEAVPGPPLTAQLVAGPADGTLSLNADGSFAYTPNTNFTGTDSFTYQAVQDGLTSNVATVTLQVNAVDTAPVANPDCYTVITGQSLSVTSDQGLLANDYDLDFDPITAQLASAPQHGTLTLNADGSFAYTPFLGFTGTDFFLYQDFDGLTTSPATKVTIDVQHAVSLFPPDDQANNEGDVVNLQFPATDANGSPITYSATGLPAGVSLDPSTGVFTGTIPYTDAETNQGTYKVTLTAADPIDSVSDNFTWFITDTNQLTQPDDQVNEPGDIVSLQLQATGGPFTFAAAGLPAGLSINSSTGLISGTVTENPAHPLTDTVTVSATAGGTTDSQQFNWTVLSQSQPFVEIAINDTVATGDDYSINLQPITARVTLFDPVPGEHDVQILVPSGLSGITNGNLLLANGQSAEIGIIPKQFSQKHNDVVLLAQVGGKQAGKGEVTNGKITLGPVDAKDTPPGMPPRIPPRVVTVVSITIDKTLQGSTLQTWVTGNGGGNGRALIDYSGNVQNPKLIDGTVTFGAGAKNIKIAGSATEQTAADGKHVGKLMLNVGVMGDKSLDIKSNGFSVAAIPVGIEVTSVEKVQGSDQAAGKGSNYLILFGAKFSLKAISDSGRDFTADLNQVSVLEKIKPVKATGAWVKLPRTAQTLPNPATELRPDRNGLFFSPPRIVNGRAKTPKDAKLDAAEHWTATFNTGGAGIDTVNQFFIFNENRTGAFNIKVANSGFQLVKDMSKDNQGVYTLTVTRTGQAVDGVQAGLIAQPLTAPQAVKIV